MSWLFLLSWHWPNQKRSINNGQSKLLVRTTLISITLDSSWKRRRQFWLRYIWRRRLWSGRDVTADLLVNRTDMCGNDKKVFPIPFKKYSLPLAILRRTWSLRPRRRQKINWRHEHYIKSEYCSSMSYLSLCLVWFGFLCSLFPALLFWVICQKLPCRRTENHGWF